MLGIALISAYLQVSRVDSNDSHNVVTNMQLKKK